jgi:radical SAM protein with 4Fe4S-binding SPASM domain
MTASIITWTDGIIHKSTLLLNRSDPKKIDHITFAVTYLCNGRCQHCNIFKKYRRNPREAKKELAFHEIKQVFNSSRYLDDLRGITLTGGEPFLRKDFADLCTFLVKKYPKAGLTIPTNGLRPNLVLHKLEKILAACTPRGVYLSVSIDGNGATHDRVRGVTGAYNNALTLIELVKKRTPSIQAGISFTITPENYEHLIEVYKTSKELRVGFGVQFAQTSASYYENEEKDFEWSETELDEIANSTEFILKDRVKSQKTTQKLAATPFDVHSYYLSHMVESKRAHDTIQRCYSGINSFFMDPFGNIFPCIMLNKQIGNVCKSNFDELWLSKEGSDVRQFIKDKRCNCWTPCETMPTLERDPKVVWFNLHSLVK